MAPFTPFFTEILYRNLRKVSNGSEESIHFCSFPQVEGKVLFFAYDSILHSYFQIILLQHCTFKLFLDKPLYFEV